MRIAVVGIGYVGLVSAACFAEIGHDVYCIDIDEEKIAKLKQGEIPIYEPGLQEVVKRNYDHGRLKFTTSIKEAVEDVSAVFIAVGTPSSDDGSVDLKAIYAVTDSLKNIIASNVIIVVKSTVPVGTCHKIKERIAKANPDLAFDVASNPEFLREGTAVSDFLNPDRVVIGTENERAKQELSTLYKPLALRNINIFTTDIISSELTKYAANAFLATKIGFINEIADICEIAGGNIHDVAKGMGMDKRISPKNLIPGPGFGGSCFPKDTLGLCAIAREAGVPTQVVESVIESNQTRKIRMAKKIVAACDGSVKDKKIAILGLAFKANTDDVRYSPPLTIISELIKQGAIIQTYDPAAMENAQLELKDDNIIWCEESYQAIKDADALAILTEWPEFKDLDLRKIKQSMANPTIIDLRGIFNQNTVLAAGFKYSAIGI